MSNGTQNTHALERAKDAAVMIAAFVAISVAIQPTSAFAIGTSFTYQGQLKKNGTPYTGNANFSFLLYTASTGGTLLGTLDQNSVAVAAGLFTTQLDFGAVFDGNPRWLEIQAATGVEGFTVLTPRQEIKSVPYAVRAENGGPSQWTTNGTSIFYNGGSVGIGTSTPASKLDITAGTEDINPAFFKNNNTNFACFATQNIAANGFGWYDAWSARHYIGGSIGMGTFTPEAKIHVTGTQYGIKATGSGSGGNFGIGVWGIGQGSILTGPAEGVLGESNYGDGVRGITSDSFWYGGYFANTGGGTALKADGLAEVRSLRILGGADIVEGFDARDDADAGGKPEPGTVLVIDEARAGELRASGAPYDRKVAGVVSGANGVAHGMKLGQGGALDGETLVAMTGRVYVKCSTENGAIRPGDLLTTSTTSGHAMRATDHALANGAVIGKAMSSLDARTGLVLVLVNLQ